MGLVRTKDGNVELVTVTDDAGADFAQTITFSTPVEIVRIKFEKPAAGTLLLQSVETGGGPLVTVGAASLGATDTAFFSNESNLCHNVNLESLLLTATGCGAGVKVSISSQNMLSEQGRDF